MNLSKHPWLHVSLEVLVCGAVLTLVAAGGTAAMLLCADLLENMAQPILLRLG